MITKKQVALKKNLDKLLAEYELNQEDINAFLYIQGAILSRVLAQKK